MEPGPVPGRSGLTAIWRPSPNCGPRRDGGTPRLIVLHYTAMTSAERAAAWLCNPESQVSAHYVIDRMGSVQQLVDEADRAWHAGAGAWGDCRDVNSNSIGLEIDNTGTMPFAAAQMNAVEALVAGIMERWSIPARGVIGHWTARRGARLIPVRASTGRGWRGRVWRRPRPMAKALAISCRRFGPLGILPMPPRRAVGKLANAAPSMGQGAVRCA